MKPIINLEGIKKEYKVRKNKDSKSKNVHGSTLLAVDNISFSINEGEIVGYIGPNGAGKSTTIKMMTSILVPTSGNIEICGFVPYKERRKYVQNIGVIFGQRSQLWWDLPAIETFKLMKDAYKIPDSVYKLNYEMLLETLEITDLIQRPVRQLSLGQRMRCEIACVLLHNPKIIFLDEPTIGLDVVAKEQMRSMIKRINQQRNTTVILTTHDMGDIEELCDRVIIIDKGKLIYDGGLESIKSEYSNMKVVRIISKSELNLNDFPADVEITQMSGNKATMRFDTKKVATSNFMHALLDNDQIADVELISTPIETIIRDIFIKESSGS